MTYEHVRAQLLEFIDGLSRRGACLADLEEACQQQPKAYDPRGAAHDVWRLAKSAPAGGR